MDPLELRRERFGQIFILLLAIGTFVFALSAIFWLAIKYTIGLRAEAEDEENGLDMAELGLERNPHAVGRDGGEFGL